MHMHVYMMEKVEKSLTLKVHDANIILLLLYMHMW